MDVSKLPKLSDTQKEQQAQAAAADDDAISATPVRRSDDGASRAYEADAGASSVGAEVWISIAVGAILLLMYPRFLKWVSSRLFGTHFDQFLLPDGTIVPYPQVPEFWGDLGPTLFGVVLLVEGIALMLARKRAVMMLAFCLTVVATAYNLIYLVMSFNRYGLALISAFAVAFGVYIAMYQWKLIQLMSPRAPSMR